MMGQHGMNSSGGRTRTGAPVEALTLAEAFQRIVATETKFLPQVRQASATLGGLVEHVIVVDGDRSTRCTRSKELDALYVVDPGSPLSSAVLM